MLCQQFVDAEPLRRQRDQTKLEQMVAYAQTAACQTHLLLEALGETVVWVGVDTTTAGAHRLSPRPSQWRCDSNL
jgi:superfamily II DNA helicase RecQ